MNYGTLIPKPANIYFFKFGNRTTTERCEICPNWSLTSFWCFYSYLWTSHCKNRQYLELIWSAFSRIQTKYGEILWISSYLFQMRENTNQNNSEYGHFLLSAYFTPIYCFFCQLWASKCFLGLVSSTEKCYAFYVSLYVCLRQFKPSM